MRFCKRGHEIAGDNAVVYRRADGSIGRVWCRECKRAAERRYQLRRRIQAAPRAPSAAICARGHAIAGANALRRVSRGRPYYTCRTCSNARDAARNARKAGRQVGPARRIVDTTGADAAPTVRRVAYRAVRDPWAMAIFGGPA